VEQWIVASPRLYQQLIEGRQFDGEETERLRRQSVPCGRKYCPVWPHTVIHEAKSSGLMPSDLSALAQNLVQNPAGGCGKLRRADHCRWAVPTLSRLLAQRGFIDYDDMILGALRTLEDPETLRFWQARCFAVFEDEAQDSSPLQTRLLETLAADPENPEAEPNLVRVG
jgi:DNA helicase-2/ATP-dependent DNA helicase PcrA